MNRHSTVINSQDNFIGWAGNIEMPDAYELKQSLHITTFPSFAIFSTRKKENRIVIKLVKVVEPVGLDYDKVKTIVNSDIFNI